MDFNDFSDLVFKEAGLIMKEYELFYLSEKELQIGVFDNQVDKFSLSGSAGASLRGVADKGMGYSYTEKLDKASVKMIVQEAAENSKITDAKDYSPLASPSERSLVEEHTTEGLDSLSVEEKINMMIALEKKALSLDDRVNKVQVCSYEEVETERRIRNSEGVNLSEENSGGYAYLSVVASENDDTRTGSSICLFRSPQEINVDKMASEAVDEALALLGAQPVKSGRYVTIFKNRVFADMLQGFIPAFTGDNVQKGMSIFNSSLGKKIGSNELTIVEDPSLDKGFGGCGFDDEGYPTNLKTVINKGILEEFFHNSKTAHKVGIRSPGNGFRDSYKKPVGTRPTNLLVLPGSRNRDMMIGDVKEGIFITDVAGLHSGLDSVSGEFSLQAQGFLIEGGKLTRPVRGITVSGSFRDLLERTVEVSDDMDYGFPGNGHYGSPSIKIDGISISGY